MANKLIFISDVEYIADNKGKRISVINESDLNKLIKNKTIKDGMVVKVENIFKALKQGVEKVHMICGTKKNCLLKELNTEEGVGTEFKKNYVGFEDPERSTGYMDIRRKAYKRYQIEEFKPQFQDQVVSFLPNDPEHILLALDIEFKNNPSVFKVNLNDGKFTRVEKARLGIREWFADRQGRLAVGVSLNYDTGEQRVYYRDNEQWKVLFEYNVLED